MLRSKWGMLYCLALLKPSGLDIGDIRIAMFDVIHISREVPHNYGKSLVLGF